MNVINKNASVKKTCPSSDKERNVTETALDEIIWRVPGSSWWRDCTQPDRDTDSRVEQTSYWLRVPCTDCSGGRNVTTTWLENSNGGKMLGRLHILRQGHSVTIGGVELTPKNSDHVICIETVVPGSGGHWKVLWSDRSKNLHLLVPAGRTGKSNKRLYKVETDPLQLSPGVRLIGWVSGRTYPPHEKEGVLPGAVTHSWCFLVPVRIDRLTQLTIYLLPPRTQNTNSPPTRARQSLDENIVTEGHFSAPVLEPYAIGVQNGNLHGGLHRGVANPDLASGLDAHRICHRTITNPLTLLLEPNSRLVMINETISALCSSRFHASSTGHLCPSEPSSDSSLDLLFDKQTDDRSNCYTYIKTKDGLPVYRNGVFISPTRNRLPPERCSSAIDGTQNSLSQSLLGESPNSHTIPYHYVFREKQMNDTENFTTQRTSKTYLLKQLDIVNAEDSVPPPWIAKLNIVKPTTNSGLTHSVDKSWSTVGTQDSPFSPRSPDIISTCVDHSNYLSMSGNNGNILSSMSPSESSVESGEEGQQKRTSKLFEVLAELNAFAESIILPSVEQQGEKGVDQDAHISESRRRILSQLTSMCDEEEEEEDTTDPEIQANQQTSGQESVKIMDCTSFDSGVSAICVPLPPSCRVSSPMRLLVCYFEILSELADLKAEASKDKLERQREWSVLADLAAALLRVLVTPSVPRRGQPLGAADRFNCGFGLRTLIRLRDILTMAPVVYQECSPINPQHIGSRRIVNIYSEQISLALEQHRLWLRALTERELRDQRESMTESQLSCSAGDYKKRIEALIGDVLSRLDKTNMNQLFDEIHNSLTQSKFSDIENQLMSLPPPEVQNVPGEHSADISNGKDQSPKSVYPDRNSELWTQLLKCCTNEVDTLVTFFSQPWVPVQRWGENLHLDSGENRVLTIADWQKNELAGWCEQRMTIQDRFRCLGRLPDLLESAELTCSKNKSSDQTKNLVNNMRSFCDQMLDRCSKLRLFECLVQLPGGVCSSLKALMELSSRLRLRDFDNLGDCELCLRQIQHQLCTELAFLRSLFDQEPNKPTSLEPESNWVPLWTDKMSNAYSAVVSAWEDRVIQLKQAALKDAFDVWVGCADLCLRTISDSPDPCSPEYLLNGETPFPVLWNLLCDAELLQEAYWRIHQCAHTKTTLGKLPLPESFTSYLNAIGNHVEFAMAACKGDSNLIPMLLQQLDHSQRENRTQVVCKRIAEALNDGYTSESTDKLRFLRHDLRYCQWLWERRLHLTIKSINLAGEPAFRGTDHGQFVQHWIESMCLRRDWQSRIVKALERIVRAAEVVDAERFPLRSIQTFETRLDQKELLYEEQSFIEAVHFGLEVIQLETNVLRTGLSVCDSQIAGSPLSSSLNSKLEELKHLYSRMIHDPRLGQSGSTGYPRSRITIYINNRKHESLKLYSLIRSVMLIDWRLGSDRLADTEWYRRTTALLGMDECLDWLETLMTNNDEHENIRKSARNLEQCIAEIQSLKFKKYNAGFSWTPISFNVELLVNQMPQDSSDEIDPALLDTCADLREQLKRRSVRSVDRNGRISLPPRDYRGKESAGQGMRLKSEEKHRTCLPAEKECLCKQRINQAVLTSTFAELEARLNDPTKEMHLLEVTNILFDLLQHRIPEYRAQPDLHRLWNSAYSSAVLRVRTLFWKTARNREALSELWSALNMWITQEQRAPENGTTENGVTVSCRSEDNGLGPCATPLSDFSDFIIRLQTLSIILSSWCTTFDTTNRGKPNPVGSCEPVCELRQLLENLINFLPTQLVPFCSECVCSKIEEFLTTNEADLDTLTSDDKIAVASNTMPDMTLFHPALRTRMEKTTNHMEFALCLLEAANSPSPGNKEPETAGKLVSCVFNVQVPMDSCLLNRLKADVKLLQNYLSMDRHARALVHQARDILRKINNSSPTGIGAAECADAEADLVKITLLEKQLKAVKLNSDNGSLHHQIAPNMIELVFLRHQLSLAQQYSRERLAVHDYTTSAPTTAHQKLEKYIMDSMATVEQMIRRFANLLNTHSSWSDKELVKLAYELRLQLPTEADIAWLYAQLTSLEKLHDELKFCNDSGNEYFPAVFDELDRCDLIESGGESSVYLTDMLQQLHSTVLSSEAVDRKLKMLNEQSHRLRDLAGALSDHALEVKSAEQQLYFAVPNLMGQHMDELASAVDELESEANDDRTNGSGPLDPLRECPQLSENITHAGQRLMELETSLEHASETLRILILLSRGANLWGQFGSVGLEDPAQSIHERNAALQSEYEQSFMCTRLRSAWARLAQLGDRLGRIQAGLPARSPVDRKKERAIETFINENMNGPPPLIAEATSKDRRSVDTSEPGIDVATAPEIDAETIRRKRLNLHDVLGSHSCVYPECKRAREEWMAFGFPVSTDQMSIDEKVRRIFVDLVHFYTRLQKNLIERGGLESQEETPGSRPTGQVDQSPRHQNWHNDPYLATEYHELMARVQEVLSCSLPQVNRLRMKANSLQKLWLGRLGDSGPRKPAGVEQPLGVGRHMNYPPEDDTFQQDFSHYRKPLELPHSDSDHLLSTGRSPNAAAPFDSPNGLDSKDMMEEALAPDNFERPWREIVDVDEQIKPVHLPFLTTDVPAAKPRKKGVSLSKNDGNPDNLDTLVKTSSHNNSSEETSGSPEEPPRVGSVSKQLLSGKETNSSARTARGQFSKNNETGRENVRNGNDDDNPDLFPTNTESTDRQGINRYPGTTGKDENMAEDAAVQANYDVLHFSDVHTQTEDSVEITVAQSVEQNAASRETMNPGDQDTNPVRTGRGGSGSEGGTNAPANHGQTPSSSSESNRDNPAPNRTEREKAGGGRGGVNEEQIRRPLLDAGVQAELPVLLDDTTQTEPSNEEKERESSHVADKSSAETKERDNRRVCVTALDNDFSPEEVTNLPRPPSNVELIAEPIRGGVKEEKRKNTLPHITEPIQSGSKQLDAPLAASFPLNKSSQTEDRDTMVQISSTDDRSHPRSDLVDNVAGDAGLVWYDVVDYSPKTNLTRHQDNIGMEKNEDEKNNNTSVIQPAPKEPVQSGRNEETEGERSRTTSGHIEPKSGLTGETNPSEREWIEVKKKGRKKPKKGRNIRGESKIQSNPKDQVNKPEAGVHQKNDLDGQVRNGSVVENARSNEESVQNVKGPEGGLKNVMYESDPTESCLPQPNEHVLPIQSDKDKLYDKGLGDLTKSNQTDEIMTTKLNPKNLIVDGRSVERKEHSKDDVKLSLLETPNAEREREDLSKELFDFPSHSKMNEGFDVVDSGTGFRESTASEKTPPPSSSPQDLQAETDSNPALVIDSQNLNAEGNVPWKTTDSFKNQAPSLNNQGSSKDQTGPAIATSKVDTENRPQAVKEAKGSKNDQKTSDLPPIQTGRELPEPSEKNTQLFSQDESSGEATPTAENLDKDTGYMNQDLQIKTTDQPVDELRQTLPTERNLPVVKRKILRGKRKLGQKPASRSQPPPSEKLPDDSLDLPKSVDDASWFQNKPRFYGNLDSVDGSMPVQNPSVLSSGDIDRLEDAESSYVEPRTSSSSVKDSIQPKLKDEQAGEASNKLSVHAESDQSEEVGLPDHGTSGLARLSEDLLRPIINDMSSPCSEEEESTERKTYEIVDEKGENRDGETKDGPGKPRKESDQKDNNKSKDLTGSTVKNTTHPGLSKRESEVADKSVEKSREASSSHGKSHNTLEADESGKSASTDEVTPKLDKPTDILEDQPHAEAPKISSLTKFMNVHLKDQSEDKSGTPIDAEGDEVVGRGTERREEWRACKPKVGEPSEESKSIDTPEGNSAHPANTNALGSEGTQFAIKPAVDKRAMGPSEIADIPTVSLKPAASAEQSSGSLSTRIKGKEIPSLDTLHQKPDFSASVDQFDSSTADGDSRKLHAVDEPPENLLGSGKTVQRVATSSTTVYGTGVLKDRPDTEPVVHDPAEELYQTKFGRIGIEEKEWVQNEPEGSHVSTSGWKAAGLGSTERDREKPSRKSDADRPTRHSRQQKGGEISETMRNKPKGTEQNVEEIPGLPQSPSDEVEDQSLKAKNETESLVQDLLDTTLRKRETNYQRHSMYTQHEQKEEDDESDEHKRLLEESELNEENVATEPSCCRRLIPLLALLLFLLIIGLFLYCLLFVPTCGFPVGWSRDCPEERWLLKHFYYPLMTLRTRRPPL